MWKTIILSSFLFGMAATINLTLVPPQTEAHFVHMIHKDYAPHGWERHDRSLYVGKELYEFTVPRLAARNFLDVAMPMEHFWVGGHQYAFKIVASMEREGFAKHVTLLYERGFPHLETWERELRKIIPIPLELRGEAFTVKIGYTFLGVSIHSPIWRMKFSGITVLGQ